MRAVLFVIIAAGASTGCAPLASTHGLPGMGSWSRPAAALPSVNLSAVLDRWDNVMMLPKGARIHVLRMDGSQAEGDVVKASAKALTLQVAAGEIEIPTEAVARVDRVLSGQRPRRALSGALHGAGLVGVLGLMAGEAPPARLFAAGALAGAEVGVHSQPSAGPQTIYLSAHVARR